MKHENTQTGRRSICLLALPGIRIGELAERMARDMQMKWADYSSADTEKVYNQIEKVITEEKTHPKKDSIEDVTIMSLPSDFPTTDKGRKLLLDFAHGGGIVVHVETTWQESAQACGLNGATPAGMVPVRATYRIMAQQRMKIFQEVSQVRVSASGASLDTLSEIIRKAIDDFK